ncbi:MAG: tripartite tricarboxylate transporter substrate binding protein [Betaproteobacteria bacterium]|nr:tripartite tricarboxylate transporter substrate binding protein [Betaproteobacteria bacterium]
MEQEYRIARRFVSYCLLPFALCLGAGGAHAQAYPTKPIRLIVPLAPGGGNDTTARLVGTRLTESLGQQVIVENRPGAGSVIASEIVAKAPADGYTLYLVSTSFTAAPALVKKLPFDPLNDFAHVTRLAVVPGALIVHASLPVRSVKEYVALARARPREITFGSAGIGSGSHLGGELFRIHARVPITHVPYKGSAIVTTALLSGEVSSAFTNPISSLPHVKAGRIRNLGLSSAERWPLLPEYPTIAESGVKGYELLIWNGISVKTGTPPVIVERLHAELLKATLIPEVVSYLARSGARSMTQSPADFDAFVRNEIANWVKVAETAGSRAN